MNIIEYLQAQEKKRQRAQEKKRQGLAGISQDIADKYIGKIMNRATLQQMREDFLERGIDASIDFSDSCNGRCNGITITQEVDYQDLSDPFGGMPHARIPRARRITIRPSFV